MYHSANALDLILSTGEKNALAIQNILWPDMNFRFVLSFLLI